MRTTLDLPDELLKKAKMMAVQEGVTLKAVVTRALEMEVTKPVDPDRPEMVRRALGEIRKVSHGIKWDGPPEMSFWEEDESSSDPLKP